MQFNRGYKQQQGTKMFESLTKKLKQFKESVTRKETELEADELGLEVGGAVSEADFQQQDTERSELEVEETSSSETSSPKALTPRGAAPETAEKEKKGLLKGRAIFEREIKENDLKEPLWGLELALLESDVAVSVSEAIVTIVKNDLVGKKRWWRQDMGIIVEEALRNGLLTVLDVDGVDFDEFVRGSPKPVTIIFTGINGTGKTTTIAKIAYRLKNQGYSVVLAAGDTYRAGAVEQIERHAENLGLKLIKHQQGADPAAVIFDAIEYARARHKDVVLADTAGRIHTNVNLMNQLKKIDRVIKADMVLFVDEAIAGNDAVERAVEFNSAMPFSGSILTKVDADAKGGAAISIAYTIGKPILFLGLGQKYEDLKKFDPQWLVDKLFEEGEA
jgi:fused signal recognition particle receptor